MSEASARTVADEGGKYRRKFTLVDVERAVRGVDREAVEGEARGVGEGQPLPVLSARHSMHVRGEMHSGMAGEEDACASMQ
eukprot:3669782-Rhodomonas_salina.2